jgi:hypothetical protein
VHRAKEWQAAFCRWAAIAIVKYLPSQQHSPAAAAATAVHRAKEWQAAFCRWAAIVMAARRESHWWEDTGAHSAAAFAVFINIYVISDKAVTATGGRTQVRTALAMHCCCVVWDSCSSAGKCWRKAASAAARATAAAAVWHAASVICVRVDKATGGRAQVQQPVICSSSSSRQAVTAASGRLQVQKQLAPPYNRCCCACCYLKLPCLMLV